MQLTEVIWDKNWEIGVYYIDEQHKHLIGLVNDIAKARIGETYKFLSDLIQYSSEHFGDEEDLMVNAGFPDIIQHKTEHRLFTRAMLAFSFRLNNGEDKLKLREELCEFVSKWFAYHFLQTDRKLAEFIKGGNFIDQVKQQFEK